eukprot:jgi/Hompol1/1005/HPOL_004808-RA
MAEPERDRPTSSSVNFPEISLSKTQNATRKSQARLRDQPSVRTRSPAVRLRNVETKPIDPQAALAVQPWSVVRAIIGGILGSKNLAAPVADTAVTATASLAAASSDTGSASNTAAKPTASIDDSQSQAQLKISSSVTGRLSRSIGASMSQLARASGNAPPNTAESTTTQIQPQSSGQSSMPILPITIPHGFQQLRTLSNARPTIQSVLYIPNSSMFVSQDSTHIQLWKGGVRIHKISTQEDKIRGNGSQPKSGSSYSGNASLPGVIAITKWLYVDKQRIYIIANARLELKVLDIHFEELCVISNPKPVLW